MGLRGRAARMRADRGWETAASSWWEDAEVPGVSPTEPGRVPPHSPEAPQVVGGHPGKARRAGSGQWKRRALIDAQPLLSQGTPVRGLGVVSVSKPETSADQGTSGPPGRPHPPPTDKPPPGGQDPLLGLRLCMRPGQWRHLVAAGLHTCD